VTVTFKQVKTIGLKKSCLIMGDIRDEHIAKFSYSKRAS